ncbi:hypothetical protein [Kangiella spongicola]|uniref:Uncharacterized protein n=1 Tax=Kangiella spongicola TaxID=796379 RepID=A0A318D489_9GAMM|nr:hypothetical protein [Kangiella spongicola]PXF64112.1 hypothetical protein DL796_02945 [Kangiella spongicola]
MYKRIQTICLFLAVIPFVSLISQSAKAADEAPPAMAEMWHFKIDGADQAKFEKALAAHAKFRKSKGDPRNWWTYTPHTGVIGRDYYIRHCCFKWSDHQKYTDLGVHKDLMENWNNGPGKYVKLSRHFYSWVDHKNSNWSKDTKSNLLRLTHHKLKPNSDIGPIVKEISDLARDIGWKRSWGWTYERDMDGVYLTLAMPSENFSGFEEPKPGFEELASKKLGEDKLKDLFSRFDKHVESLSFQIMRHRPEFSVMHDK